MILQVAGSPPPLKECAHDSTPRPAACWCELSHYGHLVCFFFKRETQGQWMEWNDFGIFLLPQFFYFRLQHEKIIYLIFLKGYSRTFLRFFLEDGTSEGFYTFGTHSCKAADFALASIDTTRGYGAEVLACCLKEDLDTLLETNSSHGTWKWFPSRKEI